MGWMVPAWQLRQLRNSRAAPACPVSSTLANHTAQVRSSLTFFFASGFLGCSLLGGLVCTQMEGRNMSIRSCALQPGSYSASQTPRQHSCFAAKATLLCLGRRCLPFGPFGHTACRPGCQVAHSQPTRELGGQASIFEQNGQHGGSWCDLLQLQMHYCNCQCRRAVWGS